MIIITLGGLHAGNSVGGRGGRLGDKDVAAPDDGRVGNRKGIFGAGNVDDGSGIHAGHEAAGVVDADGDGVSGGAAAGGAGGGDAGDDALKGAVADGVGGDLGLLAHLNVENVQLIDVQRHLEVAQIVDDAHGLGGGGAGAYSVADLDIFCDDGAADGGD